MEGPMTVEQARALPISTADQLTGPMFRRRIAGDEILLFVDETGAAWECGEQDGVWMKRRVY